MTPHPKHYLAEVPQDLRLRVLDLCIHRQWHDALDLLHQNGFTQYEWYEVVWFHDHAPTNLPPLECGGSTPLSIQPASEPETLTPNLNAEPRTRNPEPLALTPLPELRASVVNLNTQTVKPKGRRRPRSKACRLPAQVQLTLNTMLAGGCRYRDIIRSLNTQGYAGFNKANLNAWKRTGFQDWLRNRNLHAPEDVQKIGNRCTEALGRSQKVPEGELTSSTERNPYE